MISNEKPTDAEDEAAWAEIMAQPATRLELLQVLTTTHAALLAQMVADVISTGNASAEVIEKTDQAVFQSTKNMTALMRYLVAGWREDGE